ncbi:hypothetical protein ACPPVU_09095 [Mucilaginibacter sp. McL0603]|uniref:hypothetical protein n=1 Tax=Mucilaginibacter sp. McL0603 TaxID=3415670 RepID=UPI003CEB4447
MLKLQNKYTNEITDVTINLWQTGINKDLYHVLDIKDIGVLYKESKYATEKSTIIGLMEKSEAKTIIASDHSYYFDQFPKLPNIQSELHILEKIDLYCYKALNQIKSKTPGVGISDIQIQGLNLDDIWFIVKFLEVKKLITLSNIACITQIGRNYVNTYYFEPDLLFEPKNIPNKQHTTPQTIRKKAGIVSVKILKWIVVKIDAIIIGVIVTVAGGVLLICVVNYFLHKGFRI